jgi:hypothetical protein
MRHRFGVGIAALLAVIVSLGLVSALDWENTTWNLVNNATYVPNLILSGNNSTDNESGGGFVNPVTTIYGWVAPPLEVYLGAVLTFVILFVISFFLTMVLLRGLAVGAVFGIITWGVCVIIGCPKNLIPWIMIIVAGAGFVLGMSYHAGGKAKDRGKSLLTYIGPPIVALLGLLLVLSFF